MAGGGTGAFRLLDVGGIAAAGGGLRDCETVGSGEEILSLLREADGGVADLQPSSVEGKGGPPGETAFAQTGGGPLGVRVLAGANGGGHIGGGGGATFGGGGGTAFGGGGGTAFGGGGGGGIAQLGGFIDKELPVSRDVQPPARNVVVAL